MDAAEELASDVGTAAACRAMGVSRATVYRRRNRQSTGGEERCKRRQLRSLLDCERQEVLDLLHSPRFIDKAPAAAYAALLDEGVYHCSIRTMYRILHDAREVRERRNQLRHPKYKKPELLATGPNQVWSWDITKLLGPAKWTYYYLYVILDIPASLGAERANEGIALLRELIRERGDMDSYPYTGYMEHVTRWYVHAGDLISDGEWDDLKKLAALAGRNYPLDDIVLEARNKVDKAYLTRLIRDESDTNGTQD